MTSRTPTERVFGLSVGSVCLLLALVGWLRLSPLAIVFAVFGALLVGFGAFYPPALKVPNRIWWRFAQALGWVNSRVLLTLSFLLMITPVGVVMRLCGRNVLRGARGTTAWTPYPERRRNPDHYNHLF